MAPAPVAPAAVRPVPAWMRRLADGLLVGTAASLPLSISGMQIGAVSLFALALVARGMGCGVARRTPLDGALAIFFGTLAFTTLVTGNPLEAAGWARPWVVVAYFGLYWWLRERAAAERFAVVMVAAGGVAAAYGILQHFTGADWYRAAVGRATRTRPRVAGAEGYAVIGFFRNYLTYAHAMLFPLSSATALAMRGTTWAAVVAGLLALAIAFSTARGVWAAALAGVLASALLVRGGSRRLLAALVVVGGLAFVVSPGLRAQMEPIFTLGGANAGRVAIYRANLAIVHDHPVIGFGFGRYRAVAAPYYDRHPEADRRSHAHSTPLQIAAEAGLLGLAAFALLFATILRLGWQAMRAAPTPRAWAVAAGAWTGIVTFLLAGLTQYNFGDNEVATGMWAATAVLMASREA